MRVLVIADVHANLTALKAVMEDGARLGGADDVWCLGDIVGYGPDPRECIETVHLKCRLCVAGNHDLAAAGETDTSEFNPAAAEAVRWTQRQLGREDVAYLSSLPSRLEERDFTIVHGSPRDPIWEYIFSVDVAARNLSAFGTNYCLVGHTHAPAAFVSKSPDACDSALLGWNSVVPLKEGRIILNPGAVGQPRDGDPRASYAIIDFETGEFVLRRVAYDVASVQHRMRRHGLPARLIQRLTAGV